MDKLIAKAIGNCKIIRYHTDFEEVCKEYKRLLDIENKQLNLPQVSNNKPCEAAVCPHCGSHNNGVSDNRFCLDCHEPFTAN